MIVRQAPREHHKWLSKQLGGPHFSSDLKAIEAVDSNGRIWAMVGFERFTYSAAQAHFASAGLGGLRALVRPMFDYAFNQANKQILFAYIPQHSTKMQLFALNLGFRPIYALEDGYKVGDPMVIYKMTRETCRFLEAA